MDKKDCYLVGKLKDYDMGKGWFFGQFAKNELLKSDNIEVSIQKLDEPVNPKDYPHYHKRAIEINIILSGSCAFQIKGKTHKVDKGDFYVIYPYTVIQNFKAELGTEVIVIKSPSVKGDKYILSK